LVADTLGDASSKEVQFGLLWNVPAYGKASFGTDGTAYFSGYNLDQADILLVTYSKTADATTGSAATSIMTHYADAVGHAPPLPEWAAGYWHSKNRYSKQEDVLSTMEIFEKNYSIPVAVFVIDYFNWAVMGNLTFNPQNWPDPKAMVDKLKSYGTEIMVSTWPFSQGASKTYKPLEEKGYAVYQGTDTHSSIDWPDGVCGKPCHLYDASNPAARDWWWSLIKSGYFDYGIKSFWLDAAEPEQQNGSPEGSTWSVGSMQRVGMMYPWYHTKTYFDGMQAAGAKDGLMLSRSAWAGMSKHRAALWNGDTHSDFSFLSTAIQAGLSVQLSGIAWWTTGTACKIETLALTPAHSVSFFTMLLSPPLPCPPSLQTSAATLVAIPTIPPSAN
jgi:alpha-D-xyloside xylohydrolase